MAVPLLFLGNSYCAVTAAAFSTSGLLISPSSTRTERSAKDGSNINWQISQGLYMSVPNSLDVLTSGLASIFCLPRGVTVSSPNAQKGNVRIAKLYDVENSKSCRAVRERITELDLVVEQVIPVAAGSQNAASMPGGKAPVLVVATISSDGESGEKIEDTRTIEGVLAILSFLDESFDYPSSNVPQESEEDSVAIVKEKLKLAGMYLASWMRLGRGKSVSPSVGNRPEQPLIL
jgi:hypothetical protein